MIRILFTLGLLAIVALGFATLADVLGVISVVFAGKKIEASLLVGGTAVVVLADGLLAVKALVAFQFAAAALQLGLGGVLQGLEFLQAIA